ncbi:AraC family transcriptional regulator with amidase-like domain [Stella humosa]|uniref:AraC family transcriptional regulator with amidase-like domain n=1 Tax=Stella humosa TaxID=94 RepID=A0A3N1MGL0_9PROT|nr:GlxA family transcriptional regulator [Stella humosa]ROQ01897.1 AraC family transcriptional regulator with amidase-like domain [Stella humosa]BBK32286.1 AraC family transcriptional regulator [Stella humosa]
MLPADTGEPAEPRLRVGFILLHQFTLAAFSGLIDALRLAADHGGRSRQLHIAWTVMSLGGGPQQSSCGVSVMPNSGLRDAGEFDYVAVCGGNDYLNDEPATALVQHLRAAAAGGVRLLGICTGTFVIAKAGLVGDRRVCVHWNVLDAFNQRFPRLNAVVDRLFLDEGDLITCAGSTAAIDLGLYLVSRHCGRDKAQQAMRHMMLQDIRPAAVPQPHFYARLAGIADVRIRQAAQFIEQRLDDPPPVAAIARYVGISSRQLERLFHAELGVGPAAFQRRLRLEYGRWLLDNSKRTITEIAIDAGFADSAHFSRDFKSMFGSTPSHQRRALRMASAPGG